MILSNKVKEKVHQQWQFIYLLDEKEKSLHY